MVLDARDDAPARPHAARRGFAAVAAGLSGLAGSLASAADKGGNGRSGGNGGKDENKETDRDRKDRDGDRQDNERRRDGAHEDRDDAVQRRDAAQRDGNGGDTRAERRADRREQADQTADDDSAADTSDDNAPGDGAADRLRDRADDLRNRLGAEQTAADDDGGNGPVDITVDLEQEAEEAVDVDLNIPDLSDLLADLPESAAGVEDDITFAQAGDSLALSGDLGTFAISNPDDDGGDNDVDFSS